jgi:hypothetical protein
MSKYPAAFIERMMAKFGAEYDAFISSLDNAPVTSIRTNPAKYKTADSTLPIDSENSMDKDRILSVRTPVFYFRPVLSCRHLLCTGGFQYVFGTSLYSH